MRIGGGGQEDARFRERDGVESSGAGGKGRPAERASDGDLGVYVKTIARGWH